MTDHEITEELFEILNGLSVGWMLANVRDDAKRAELQAPVIAAQEAAKRLLDHFEPLKEAGRA
jgi:hypothetical protein